MKLALVIAILAACLGASNGQLDVVAQACGALGGTLRGVCDREITLPKFPLEVRVKKCKTDVKCVKTEVPRVCGPCVPPKCKTKCPRPWDCSLKCGECCTGGGMEKVCPPA